MSVINNYFEKQKDILKYDFEIIRQIHKDSSVKGGVNEKIIQEFLLKHYSSSFIINNVSVIDSYGEISDEIDVCVCNQYQPFTSLSSSKLLIAEGIDFVVQVKAVLSTTEISRIIKNAQRLKKLKRKALIGSTVQNALPEDQEFFLLRIPYIVFCFTSQINSKKCQDELIEQTKNIPIELQPDALFVLDKGITVINFREGKGQTWTSGGKNCIGWTLADSGDYTILEMMKYIFRFVPTFTHPANPLLNYFDLSTPYKVRGII